MAFERAEGKAIHEVAKGSKVRRSGEGEGRE